MTDPVSQLVGDSDNIRMTDPVSELVDDSENILILEMICHSDIVTITN
jgi:hypothetical protein